MTPARLHQKVAAVGAAPSYWAVYERKGDRWSLWQIAPTHRTAREVAAALARFTRLRFHLFPIAMAKPPSPVEIVAVADEGRRRTWGHAAGEWHAWQVRDALARSIGDAIRAGRATSLKPWHLAMRERDGRLAYSNESDTRFW